MVSISCGIALFMVCVENWRDPPSPVTLDISTNISKPLRVGQVTQFNCTARNHREEATLEWKRVLGSKETREQAGRSTLVHTRILTVADHSTELYCGSWFLRRVDGHLSFFYATSKRIPIRLRVAKVATPPNTDGEQVCVNIRPKASSYKVRDQVSWACDAKNIAAGFVEMRQGKNNIEKKLYSGYQMGYRWLHQNLTEADNGTYVYCTVYIHDFQKRLGYSINVPPVYINLK